MIGYLESLYMFYKSKDGTAQGVAKQRLIETLALPEKGL